MTESDCFKACNHHNHPITSITTYDLINHFYPSFGLVLLDEAEMKPNFCCQIDPQNTSTKTIINYTHPWKLTWPLQKVPLKDMLVPMVGDVSSQGDLHDPRINPSLPWTWKGLRLEAEKQRSYEVGVNMLNSLWFLLKVYINQQGEIPKFQREHLVWTKSTDEPKQYIQSNICTDINDSTCLYTMCWPDAMCVSLCFQRNRIILNHMYILGSSRCLSVYTWLRSTARVEFNQVTNKITLKTDEPNVRVTK